MLKLFNKKRRGRREGSRPGQEIVYFEGQPFFLGYNALNNSM